MLRIVLVLAGCAIAQEVYENASLNAMYETPPGWTIGSADTSLKGDVTLTASSSGLKSVTMRAKKYGSAEAADFAVGDEIFYRIKVLFNGTESTQAPLISYIQDTVYAGLPVHYTGVIIKQVDLGIVVVEYAAANQNYVHSFIYSTTLADFNSNRAIYDANWSKFLFISLNGPATKITSSAPPVRQGDLNKSFIDALGRKSLVRNPLIFRR